MKSKKIDISDIDDINEIQGLGDFLCKLDIKSADQLLDMCDDILTEDFCSECETHKDGCECNDGGLGGCYMREYDDGADYED